MIRAMACLPQQQQHIYRQGLTRQCSQLRYVQPHVLTRPFPTVSSLNSKLVAGSLFISMF